MKIKIYSASGKEYEALEKYQYDDSSQTIIVNSLKELFKLPTDLGKDIIIQDTNYTFLHQEELLIYDDYLE